VPHATGSGMRTLQVPGPPPPSTTDYIGRQQKSLGGAVEDKARKDGRVPRNSDPACV